MPIASVKVTEIMQLTILEQNVDVCNSTHIQKMQTVRTEYILPISMQKSEHNCYHFSQIVFLTISLPTVNKEATPEVAERNFSLFSILF